MARAGDEFRPPISRKSRRARTRCAVETAILSSRSHHDPVTSPVPENDPLLAAIADRVRTVVAQNSTRSLDVLAAALHAEPEAFHALVNDDDAALDRAVLIDVIAALVREFGVDPQWLLTGQYDGAVHSRALSIAEDRSDIGERALRDFVHEQYRKTA